MATPDRGPALYVNEQFVAIELERQLLFNELGELRVHIIDIDKKLDFLRKLETRLRQNHACET